MTQAILEFPLPSMNMAGQDRRIGQDDGATPPHSCRADVCFPELAAMEQFDFTDKSAVSSRESVQLPIDDHARSLIESPIEFVASPSFSDPDAESIIWGTAKGAGKDDTDLGSNGTGEKRPPGGTPLYLAELYAIPLLAPEQEYDLFRKMNFLKFQAERIRQSLDSADPQPKRIDEIESRLRRSLSIRNLIVRANLRLVVSIAKKLTDPANSLDEVISDGNVPLIRAVELFDFERGTRFSTYATWAIRNYLYRSTHRNRNRTKRYRTGKDQSLEFRSDTRNSQTADERARFQLMAFLESLVNRLDRRDQTIVRSRFGLLEDGRPRKFREIAEQLNLSTERVRQLLIRSLQQMRAFLDTTPVDLDALIDFPEPCPQN